jgi:hypothetical protein
MPAKPWRLSSRIVDRDETCDVVSAAPDDAEQSVRFRRGWMLGDGTGAGKGHRSPASSSTIG